MQGREGPTQAPAVHEEAGAPEAGVGQADDPHPWSSVSPGFVRETPSTVTRWPRHEGTGQRWITVPTRRAARAGTRGRGSRRGGASAVGRSYGPDRARPGVGPDHDGRLATVGRWRIVGGGGIGSERCTGGTTATPAPRPDGT